MTDLPETSQKDINLLKTYWLPLVTLLAVVLLTFLFVKPKIVEISQIRQNIKKDKASLSALTQKVVALEGLSLPTLQERANITFKVLPERRDIPMAMATVRALTAEIGADLSSLEVDPEDFTEVGGKEKSGISAFKVTASLAGTDEALRLFLEKIKSVTPLTQTLGLDFTSERLQGQGSMEIQLISFFLPLPESIGKVDSPVPVISPSEETTFQTISQLASPIKPVSPVEIVPVPSGKENPFSF